MKEKITIYTNETCPYCDNVKNRFKAKGLEFVEKPTKDYQEEYNRATHITSVPTVPTILYQDTYFVPGRDFQNPEQLMDLLSNFKKPNVDNNTLILEKIKTLKYNIMMMLHNLNAELRQINTNLNNNKDEHESAS